MEAIVRICLIVVFVVAGSADAIHEQWGYVEVREKANMFWWFLKSPQRVSSAKPWPTILWLQGGLVGSAVGRGNFLEIGPLDVNLQPRNSTWLQRADLIFVDCPVGVGYSYVEDPSALATTDPQVAADIMELLKSISKKIPTLQSSPLFLAGEFYGGKLAAMLGVSMARAIRDGSLKLTLGGVGLGDSWISPDDFARSYAQLLQGVSRLDDGAVPHGNRMAAMVKKQMAGGQFAMARSTWIDLLDFIDYQTDSVNVENFLLDTSMNPLLARSSSLKSIHSMSQMAPNSLNEIMNGVIKKKLKIPKDVIWQEVSPEADEALAHTFMKPAINEVDELISYGVNVTVYNGQLDVICSTIGVEAWVKNLKWDGLKNFLRVPRQPLYYCDSSIHCSSAIKAYVRSYENLHLYWILGAGLRVPADQPDVALSTISSITQSPGS